MEVNGHEFFTLRAVPPTQFTFNRVPFCDGFTPRFADRRGLAPSALEPISDPETISEAVWIADAVLAFEAAMLVNYMGIEALQTLQLFISQDVRANLSCALSSYQIEPTARDIPQQTQEPRARSQEPKAKAQGPGPRGQEPGARAQTQSSSFCETSELI